MKVYNAIPTGDMCGWATCGTNLAKEFSRYEMARNMREADVILTPVVNYLWQYPADVEAEIRDARNRGKKVVGYGFHEWPSIGARQIWALAGNFDGIACGSSEMLDWVEQALRGVGCRIPATSVFQGVNTDLFNPGDGKWPPMFDGKFVVASAGKFEYRKGQDVVIEAFRRFSKMYDNVVLTFAWDNPWPDSMASMQQSKWIKFPDDIHLVVPGIVGGIRKELVDADKQLAWRIGPNSSMPNFYRAADVAIFPNRYEAGTNLCMMEALACGTPVIATAAHGHLNIAEEFCGLSRFCGIGGDRTSPDGWTEPCVDELVSRLRAFYEFHDARGSNADMISEVINENFTWDKTAKGLMWLCQNVLG